MAVFSRVALRTGAEILIWFCIQTCASIHTGRVRATVIQIFVTQNSTPVLFTSARPGLHAGPMHTPRVQQTLIAQWTLPAIFTHTFSWIVTHSMKLTAALFTDSCLAVWPDPALHALLIAGLITLVMAKVIISVATMLVALVAVVILVTAHTHAVLEAGRLTLVPNKLLFLTGVHFTTINTSLDQQFITVVSKCLVVPVPSIHDQSVCTRPGKLKGYDNGPEVIGLVWVSIESFQLKRISPEHARARSAVCTETIRGDLHLVFL